jgi:hypothetical protein
MNMCKFQDHTLNDLPIDLKITEAKIALIDFKWNRENLLQAWGSLS